MRQARKFEVVAFFCGAILMIYELVAARILAPSIGSSTYVWTSVIGVIIAALAAGYWAGGVIADKRNNRSDVSVLLLAVAVAILFTQIMYDTLLGYIGELGGDPRIQGVVAALLLFAPASFVLGMISPYLAKLNVTSLGVSGRRVANLGALNSLGGIFGTFLTGFVLLSIIGSHELLSVLIVLTVAVSWLIDPGRKTKHRIALSIFCIAMTLFPKADAHGVVDIDTPSAHYQVVKLAANGREATGLLTGPNGIQSAVYDDNPMDPVFWYTSEMMRLTVDHKPDNILLLGGGAFTIPMQLAEKLPDAMIDVVEIDPKLLDIAEDYFQYSQPDNVTHYFEDARRFVNQSEKKYDVILVDVYGDGAIPFTFITKEYGAQIDRLLNDNGIVLVNVIGGMAGGACEEVTRAVDAAYSSYFPYRYYSTNSAAAVLRGNIIMQYSKSTKDFNNMQEIGFAPQSPLLDNRAPSELLYQRCQNIT